MSPLANASVQRVREALAAAGVAAEVIALAETARSAEDAARAVGAELGAIVKSLVFIVDDRPVLALVAGDRHCREQALPAILGLTGRVRRADAATVRSATGYAIGGVPPLAHTTSLPTAVDPSLARFPVIWAAAGHPHCVFATTFGDLVRLTGGIASPDLAG